MSDRSAQECEAVAVLAEALGVSIRPEHLAEVMHAWRMMTPHRARMAAADLPRDAEPAALFRP